MSSLAVAPTFVHAAPRSTRTATSAVRSAPSKPSGSLRLTTRGRALVALVALLAASGLFVLQAQGSNAGPVVDRSALSSVVVQPGDTLWQVARDALPQLDPREAVQVIREINALGASTVQPGQSLLVPSVR